MGEDHALAFTRWHEWEAILSMATVCMAARASARPSAGAAPAVLPKQAQVRLLRLPDMPESATEVRQRAAAGADISHLVPPAVASYIDRHHLYRIA
jgi:nicotinate-nucleotide adenylyltransferase